MGRGARWDTWESWYAWLSGYAASQEGTMSKEELQNRAAVHFAGHLTALAEKKEWKGSRDALLAIKDVEALRTTSLPRA